MKNKIESELVDMTEKEMNEDINNKIESKTNYEEDIKINRNELDLEWLRQPELIGKYSRELAQAQLELDKLDERISVITAEKELEIRTNPEKFGLEKITEGALKTILQMDKELIGMRNAISEKKFEVNILSGALKALDNKKKALENIVTLHGQQYFASPSSPLDINRESIKEHKKESAMEKIKERIRRRTI